MIIKRGNLTFFIASGVMTLQVQQSLIGDPADVIEMPDEWFHRIKDNGMPCTGKEYGGLLYLSRAGYEANKHILKAAVDDAVERKIKRQPDGGFISWDFFEAEAGKHFKRLEQKIQSQIKHHEEKIAHLKKFVV